jgi:hypothetical protein
MPSQPILPMSGTSLNKRIGSFVLAFVTIDQNPESARAALDGMVVIRAQPIYSARWVAYVAMHDEFEEVPDGLSFDELPFYTFELTRQPDGSFERVMRKTIKDDESPKVRESVNDTME